MITRREVIETNEDYTPTIQIETDGTTTTRNLPNTGEIIITDDVNIKYQLFNVATSRAEIATFIIAPESKISMITEKNSSMCEFISLLYKKQHAIFIRQPMSTL